MRPCLPSFPIVAWSRRRHHSNPVLRGRDGSPLHLVAGRTMIADTTESLSRWWAPALAFFAGIVSFASPCVFPLVPGYLSFVTGESVATIDREPAGDVATRTRNLL